MANAVEAVPVNLDWQDGAACAGKPPAWWFPDPEETRGGGRAVTTAIAQAVAVCQTCPAIVECGAYAEATHQPVGVWGGKLRGSRQQSGHHGRAGGKSYDLGACGDCGGPCASKALRCRE